MAKTKRRPVIYIRVLDSDFRRWKAEWLAKQDPWLRRLTFSQYMGVKMMCRHAQLRQVKELGGTK